MIIMPVDNLKIHRIKIG